MKHPASRKDFVGKQGETISTAVWMSAWAGLGAVFVALVLGGGFYFFEAPIRTLIDEHIYYIEAGIPIVFVAAFGISLALTLENQFRRGKWR